MVINYKQMGHTQNRVDHRQALHGLMTLVITSSSSGVKGCEKLTPVMQMFIGNLSLSGESVDSFSKQFQDTHDNTINTNAVNW